MWHSILHLVLIGAQGETRGKGEKTPSSLQYFIAMARASPNSLARAAPAQLHVGAPFQSAGPKHCKVWLFSWST